MKNTLLILVFIITGISLSAQLDLTTNLGDLGPYSGSIFLETRVSKRTSLDFGLISRRIDKNFYSEDDNGNAVVNTFNKHVLLSRIDYKVYFSKSKYELQGWYFSIFNRNEFLLKVDEDYVDRHFQLFGDDPYFKHPIQSVELGFTIGWKKVLKKNLIFYTSIGYSAELFEYFGLYSGSFAIYQFNPIFHLGLGYRFQGKNKKEDVEE